MILYQYLVADRPPISSQGQEPTYIICNLNKTTCILCIKGVKLCNNQETNAYLLILLPHYGIIKA